MRVNGAPRPAFDSGDWIERADGGASTKVKGAGSMVPADPADSLRHRLPSRMYATPLRTSADHEDDELRHGGLTRHDHEPLEHLLFLALMVMAGVLVVLAGVIGAYW